MARCSSCSAPLPTNQLHCLYCKTRNDLDLHGIDVNVIKQSNCKCPSCNITLQTLNIDVGQGFEIDQCQQCFGLFFDIHELPLVLEQGTSNIAGINQSLIQQTIDDRFIGQRAVRYRKCPLCEQFMHRSNYAYRSGVIIDSCRQHGVWLDNGELIQLLEWTKAGGKLLEEQAAHRQTPKAKIDTQDWQRLAQSSTPKHNLGSISIDDAVETVLNKVLNIFI